MIINRIDEPKEIVSKLEDASFEITKSGEQKTGERKLMRANVDYECYKWTNMHNGTPRRKPKIERGREII